MSVAVHSRRVLVMDEREFVARWCGPHSVSGVDEAGSGEDALGGGVVGGGAGREPRQTGAMGVLCGQAQRCGPDAASAVVRMQPEARSEERRVGRESR